jgi:hypothetical protein
MDTPEHKVHTGYKLSQSHLSAVHQVDELERPNHHELEIVLIEERVQLLRFQHPPQF